MRMKDLFMEAHEELISEYMERHPKADYSEAYSATADDAHDRMTDKMAYMADMLRKE